jgi:hypothetical protein
VTVNSLHIIVYKKMREKQREAERGREREEKRGKEREF